MTHELYTEENRKSLITGIESMLFIASYQRLVENVDPLQHLSLNGVVVEDGLTRVERARADPETLTVNEPEALNNPIDPFNEASILDGSHSERGDDDDDLGRYIYYS
jgi:hypothetical protein